MPVLSCSWANGSGKTNLRSVSLLGAGHGLRGRPYASLRATRWPGRVRDRRDCPYTSWRTRHRHGPCAGGGRGQHRTHRAHRWKDRSAGALGDYVKHVFLIPAMGWAVHRRWLRPAALLDRLVLATAPGMRSSLNQDDRASAPAQPPVPDAGTFAKPVRRARGANGRSRRRHRGGARLDANDRLSALIEETRAAQGTAPFPHAAVVARHAGSGPRGCAPRPKPRMPSAFFWRNSGTGPRGGLDPRRASPERPARGPRPEECLGRHLLLWRAKALLAGPAFAKAELIKTLEGTALLVLLDEVAAHLDTRRRKALFDEIRGSSPGLDDRNRAELFRL